MCTSCAIGYYKHTEKKQSVPKASRQGFCHDQCFKGHELEFGSIAGRRMWSPSGFKKKSCWKLKSQNQIVSSKPTLWKARQSKASLLFLAFTKVLSQCDSLGEPTLAGKTHWCCWTWFLSWEEKAWSRNLHWSVPALLGFFILLTQLENLARPHCSAGESLVTSDDAFSSALVRGTGNHLSFLKISSHYILNRWDRQRQHY